MKNIIQQIFLISLLLSLVSCSSSTQTSPTQNRELDIYTQSSHKTGALQDNLDNWFKKDFNPKVNKDKEIQKKYPKTEKNSVKKSDRSFTLQEYVDKAVVYRRDVADTNNSHSEKLKSLPVIGN